MADRGGIADKAEDNARDKAEKADQANAEDTLGGKNGDQK
ncbi:hypothetical protein MN0502_17220 [Arthrobacter sp. MN05-02]|nr:hypothetical protein MN0502_17220 [Arthrobacter sp. MN05-02]